ncbi:hypothetical protein PV325_008280 [Microctonus aethiopoides]|nr:hypothetical protein PV325_008280 [Microctonus aethiopoides]KAK0077989.1 hypothetical protein PV326_009671 [Microctonus aethiopoides]
MAHSKLRPEKGIFTCTGKGHNRIASQSKKVGLWSDGQVQCDELHLEVWQQCRNKFSFGQLIMFALRTQLRCTRDATYVSKILPTPTGTQFQMSLFYGTNFNRKSVENYQIHVSTFAEKP